MIYRLCCATAVLLWAFLVLPTPAIGQERLLEERWRAYESVHFTVFSQLSPGRSERFLRDLEVWRLAAGWKIMDGSELPAVAVENHVYLFASDEDFAHFSTNEESGLFYHTPRNNLMAVVYGDDESLMQARHHYVHFLVSNFANLRTPRWYEEGLAGYLANLEVDGRAVAPEPYSQDTFAGLLRINDEITVEELLFDESALASPRRVQIANLKSELLLYFLWHAQEEEGFSDYRPQLNRYLELSRAGRSARFAFDQAFDLTAEQLEQQYLEYLQESRRPQSRFDGPLAPEQIADSAVQERDLDKASLANALGELALNGGLFTLAQTFYQAGVESGVGLPRSFSGLADSLRFQEDIVLDDGALAGYYGQALSLGPENPLILLDYGEYLESLLEDCERSFSAAQSAAMQEEILVHFTRALEVAPQLPETHLAMAEYYLLDGQDSELGLAFHQSALELLPADTFIMEQAVKYRVARADFEGAETLIDELSKPLHIWTEPGWVADLRSRLEHGRSGTHYDACAEEAGP